MKALIGTGLCVALALLTTRAIAEDVQWRSAVPALGAPSAASAPSGVTPVAYSVPPAADSPASSLSLGTPIAAGGPMQTSSPPERQSSGITLDRPMPLIRGQAPDTSAQPLPVGFPQKGDNGKDPKGAPVPQTIKPVPMPLDSDFAAPMPRSVKGAPTTGDSYITSSPSILDGGGIMNLGDCGCGCMADCCCDGDDCCPYRGNRVYASASYLGWSFQRKNVPPLATISPVGTSVGTTGVLGQPTTIVVVDRGSQEDTFHSGGRFTLGIWMPRSNWALEVDYLFLGRNSKSVGFGSTGDPQIARPVIIGGNETVQFVAQPGLVTGSVGVNMNSQLWGIEMNARNKWLCGVRGWVDIIYGFRHLDLSEGITIGENLVQLNPAGNLGILISDNFQTRNTFNGPQMGLQAECHFLNRWFVGGTFKLAMGDMHEQVKILGTTAYTPLPAGTTSTFNSGILAAGSNIGNHQRDTFAVIPELNFKLGFEFNDHWRIWVGYDFMFVSNVARVGDQIDRRVNPSQIPLPPPVGAQALIGPAQPAVLFRTTSFIAQGVSCGVEYRW